MVLEIREIRSRGEFDLTDKDWNEVLRTSGEDDVFLRREWLSAWWDTYGKGREMLVLEVVDRDRVVGYAPFAISGRRLSTSKTVELIGSGPSDRCAILAEQGRADVHTVVWEHMMRREGWDTIDLRDTREDCPTAINAARIFPSAEIETNVSPYVTIASTYEEYIRGLEKKNRHSLQRCWRRLSEKHDVTFGVRKPKDAKDDEFREFVRLGKARWEGTGTDSVLGYPDMVKFVERAVAGLAKDGIPTLHYLKEGDKTIAIGLGFEYLQRYLCYLSGFDPEFSTYSPGSLLVGKVIEMCHQRGLKETDLLRGAEAYKYRFNAADRSLVRFRISRARPERGLLGRFARKSGN
ncbi:MAG: GNAT family N-acetyltransferase [Methanomassiliicoccales archaeon]|nr:GNAT family N-acetyltransferase [Methanomassiliicoccales archaeon]